MWRNAQDPAEDTVRASSTSSPQRVMAGVLSAPLLWAYHSVLGQPRKLAHGARATGANSIAASRSQEFLAREQHFLRALRTMTRNLIERVDCALPEGQGHRLVAGPF